jgi:hypothetical protein
MYQFLIDDRPDLAPIKQLLDEQNWMVWECVSIPNTIYTVSAEIE